MDTGLGLTWRIGGIGPEDQLEIVANSAIDGETMIGRNEWINLPVGYNLEDHTNVSFSRHPKCLCNTFTDRPQTDTVIAHPDVVFYDFYEAYDDPIEEDRDAYLSKCSTSATGMITIH